MNQIRGFNRLSADFRIEVHAASAEAAGTYNVVHRQSHGLQIDWELVRIPAEQRVAAIDVEGAEDSKTCRRSNLVFKAVTCEQRMVCFQVDLDFILQSEVL